jgi:DNA-binding CsgD family transcriptional regulator
MRSFRRIRSCLPKYKDCNCGHVPFRFFWFSAKSIPLPPQSSCRVSIFSRSTHFQFKSIIIPFCKRSLLGLQTVLRRQVIFLAFQLEKLNLTPKEIEVLKIAASGAQNDEIAGQLFISPHTVKTHLSNIYKKIDVKNRFQAMLWTAENLP